MNELKILCPYCSNPYTAEMLVELEDKGSGCESCYISNPTAAIEIKCSNCKKLVYKKEYSEH